MKDTQCHYFCKTAPKLRRFLPFALCLILLQTVFFSASAQGEWKWANYWTGNDDPLSSTNAYNYVVKTAFDEEGNIYAFGACGGSAQIAAQNQNVHMLNIPIVLTANTMGSVLAKYDRNGNLLWHRLIKNSGSGEDCYPFDMFFNGDRIMISGNYQFQTNDNLWFFDTLIYHQHVSGIPLEEQHPPFAVGNYTYFVTFDLDGNRLESVFVHTLSRDITNGQRANFYLGYKGFICVDSHRNTYVAVDEAYSGADTMPYTVVVEKDTARRTYDVFFPENCYEYEQGAWNAVNNTLFCKLSPEWELEWVHRVIDHTNGLSPALSWDTINPYFTPCTFELSIDDNDEVYLSGYLTDMMMMDEYNQYPMYIYWDSVHYATVLDCGMAYYTPYIIKYDSDGNVLWSNQIYVSHPSSNTAQNKTIWKGNAIYDNSVYLVGGALISDDVPSLFYFDEESNNMPVTQITEYFVRFNAQTGDFENWGIVPGDRTSIGLRGSVRPAVINNHLITLAISYSTDFPMLLCYFNTNGEFEKADTIVHMYDNKQQIGKIIVDNDGYILCDMMNSQDLTFGHDMTLDLYNDNRSCAIIALKYDPSILEPYPEGPLEVAQYDERLDCIRLYPNPAANHITIESPEDLPIDGVAITNLAGQFLGVRIVDATHADINVRNLAPGTYIAHINTRMGNTDRKFVVKR